MSKQDSLLLLIILLLSHQLQGKQVIELEDYNHCCNSILSLVELDNETFATGSYDGIIRIFSFQEKKKIYHYTGRLIGHTAAVTSLAKLNDQLFISSSQDKTIRIWKKNIFQDYICKTILKHEARHSLSLLPLNNKTFLSYGQEQGITTWNIDENGNLIEQTNVTSSSHNSHITAVAKLNDSCFACGSITGEIHIKSKNNADASGYKIQRFASNQAEGVHTLAILDNGDVIASYSKELRILSLNPTTQLYEHTSSFKIHNEAPLIIPIDNNSFATTSWDQNPKHYDPWNVKIFTKNANNSYECHKMFQGITGDICSLIRLNNGRLVAGDIEGKITILRMADLEQALKKQKEPAD